MMRRRDLLRGVSMTALTAVWSRVARAAGIARVPAKPPAPIPPRYFTAGDHIDRMWRDVYRRKIDSGHFMRTVFNSYLKELRKLNRGEVDEVSAAARMLALHSEALRYPAPPREISPLPADQVGVAEVMALLRRAIAGEVRIVVAQPWSDVCHTHGDFSIDGWRLTGFRRNYGIKYIESATSPDGRRGSHDSWSAREGNPVALLTDDEQDALDDLLEKVP
ncbi:MAG: hypothetical protein J0H40_19345 [Rhizobiales bacterium]|nr:hypothetical protein [Hyphomicrobiales bacterium]